MDPDAPVSGFEIALGGGGTIRVKHLLSHTSRDGNRWKKGIEMSGFMAAHSVAFGEERLNHMARAAQHVLQQANISYAGAHVVQRFSARTATRKPWSRSESPFTSATESGRMCSPWSRRDA